MFKGLHLTLLMGSGFPRPAPREVLDSLTQAQVSAASQGRSGFQLSFALETRKVAETLLGIVSFGLDPAARVIIIVTVGGVPSVLMDGVITHHQIGTGEGGRSTITFTGEDLSSLMDLVDGSGIPYPSMPPEARVALILARYAGLGVVPAVVPPVVFQVENDATVQYQQKGTDLAYINALARRAGYVFHLDPGPAPGTSLAYWGPEIRISPPERALTVDMGPHTNVESLSFALDTQAKTLSIVNVQNPETKAIIPIPIPSENPLSPPLAAVPQPPVKITRETCAAKLSPSQALLLGLGTAARAADTATGSGKLDVQRYGGLLKPRRIVPVRGASPAYDGLYYVKRVSTDIRRGACTQSFTLGRNGLFPTIPRAFS